LSLDAPVFSPKPEITGVSHADDAQESTQGSMNQPQSAIKEIDASEKSGSYSNS